MTTTAAAHALALGQDEKERRLLPELEALVQSHHRRCEPYARILAATGQPTHGYAHLADVPWLPVRMFKHHKLSSVADADVARVLTSSGTTGEPSRIYLDRAASATQTRELGRTLRAVLPPERLPMLLVESRTVVGDGQSYSARGAGALGLIMFGRDHVWLLDEHGQPDLDALKRFLDRHGGAPFLIFGFTFMVWLFLYEAAKGLDLSHGILIHSGGWKRLVERAVDNAEFRRRLLADTGLRRVHNFYGMVEQLGTVFLEGPSGNDLYCPDFADVVIRDPLTFAELPPGQPGLIEVVSTLPTSYPGNAVLTEDLGIVHGTDDGDWPGKRFTVLGRLARAEARGCSDTFTRAGDA